MTIYVIYIYVIYWPSIKQFVLFADIVLKNRSKSIIVLVHFSYHAAH